MRSRAAAANAAPIRVGWAETPGHLAPLVAVLAKKHPQIMPGDGKTYDFEPIRFPGSTPQIQALAIHELEVAAFSDSAFALAITNAHLDVQIVADVIQTGHAGYFPGEYVVAKDGPIKTIADVKGKRVATNAIGSEADSTMRAMLRKHAIKDSDFTTVEANFANQPAMLEEGKVDMIELLPQFAHDLMATGKYRILFTAAQVNGISEAVFWCVRADFIAAHRPAMIDFLTDYMRAVRWFLDPKNRKEALAILAGVTHKPLQDLQFAFTAHDFYRSPDLIAGYSGGPEGDRRRRKARRPAEGHRGQPQICRSVAGQSRGEGPRSPWLLIPPNCSVSRPSRKPRSRSCRGRAAGPSGAALGGAVALYADPAAGAGLGSGDPAGPGVAPGDAGARPGVHRLVGLDGERRSGHQRRDLARPRRCRARPRDRHRRPARRTDGLVQAGPNDVQPDRCRRSTRCPNRR